MLKSAKVADIIDGCASLIEVYQTREAQAAQTVQQARVAEVDKLATDYERTVGSALNAEQRAKLVSGDPEILRIVKTAAESREVPSMGGAPSDNQKITVVSDALSGATTGKDAARRSNWDTFGNQILKT